MKSSLSNNNFNEIKNKKHLNKYFLNKPMDLSSFSDRKNKTSINFFKSNNIINNDKNSNDISEIKDKYNDENISFISDEKLKGKSLINFQNTNNNLKTIKDLEEITNKEKDLLIGFNTPIEQEKIDIKYSNSHLKERELENYIKDVKLYEIVNKIQIEKERKMNLFKDNLLRKKLEGKKIFEKNFRKVKFK